MTDLSAFWRINPSDADPAETREWLDAFDALVQAEGRERATFLLRKLLDHARARRVPLPPVLNTPYKNSIALADQAPFPGNLELEQRLSSIVRWNALAMVVRANRAHAELGGHIASYASAADLFEVGFNHFFRGGRDGDLVYFQPHSAPGIYARAFLEGRLSEERLNHYRQETGGAGLCSYCHPYLMPEFWQFPTGSMGLGPLNAIYQARFMRYLEHRGIQKTAGRKLWAFVGDGEMDEPESLAGLSLAARDGLDNLIFVVNCNLQRLDGPVRGNGSIVQELEGLFAGAGWNVIKLLWGSDWDPLFARDEDGVLLKRLHETVDGEFQTYAATDGRFNREHFFNKYPELRQIIAHMSPTVILAKTKKGYGMGLWGQGKMGTHQQKKLDDAALKEFRDRFALPLSDEDVVQLRFFHPGADSQEIRYLEARRKELGGYLPMRTASSSTLTVPSLQSSSRNQSTTMAFVQLLAQLMKDETLGARVVPIVADEARTFGMQTLFRQFGIYSALGQLYEPEDHEELLYYREAKDGQILEEGITEAGALSSWLAAATSYSSHGTPMLPFYIYYSMFGFQRVGDLIWAAADSRARGFLVGGTAGRTTLAGEGLQHQDGSSHLAASAIPNCRAYDPCFGYELAAIVHDGARRMLEGQEDVFYYVTVGNENYPHPAMPEDAAEGILKGMYQIKKAENSKLQLLGSGAILREVIAAAELLEKDWGIQAAVWSVTSFTELRRDGMRAERARRFGGSDASWAEECLSKTQGPVVAASDYVRAVADLIRPYVPRRFVALGTDGFGRSDTRAALRAFFEVDARNIAVAALAALESPLLPEALRRYGIDPGTRPPWER
ncbi:MAG: pyruvate dehydrogenase E1 component [Betaproteobacteria bacterium]|nr:MAG: pyruvate dehydrogenase E1 component [Betaproteobacteria bacterium]